MTQIVIHHPGSTYAARTAAEPGWGIVKFAIPVGSIMLTADVPFHPDDLERVQSKAWLRAQVLQVLRTSVELFEPDDIVEVKPNDGGQEIFADETA